MTIPNRLKRPSPNSCNPLKNVPFPVVIKGTTGFSVIEFKDNNRIGAEVLKKLRGAMNKALKTAFQQGIFSKRPNEVGNYIEPFVRNALNSTGLKAAIPRTRKGGHKASGYPDIEIQLGKNKTAYLECKTYNKKSRDSTFRAFYLEPSANPKVTSDANHFLVGFEIKVQKRRGKRAYVPVSWQLYDLYKLKVQVKHEFNASNKEIYHKDALLAEGHLTKKSQET